MAVVVGGVFQVNAFGAEVFGEHEFKTSDGLCPQLRGYREAGEARGRRELTGRLVQTVVVVDADVVVIGQIVEVIEQRSPELANLIGWYGRASACTIQYVGQAVDSKPNRHVVPAEIFDIGFDIGGWIGILFDPINGHRKGK